MSVNKEREVPVRIIFRKKHHGHAHHGGAWKVAFADFMTAMFAMFLVLWLISQSSDVKSAIAGYFQDPLGRSDEFGSSIMPGDGAQASTVRPLRPADVVDLRHNRMQMIADRIERKIQEVPGLESVRDKIEISMTDEGLQIQLLEDSLGVFFQSGDARPSLRGRQILALLGHELAEMPNPVLIAGYTDAQPYRRADGYSNWELSADRANAARRIMLINGVPESRIAQIRGFADRQLRDPAHPLAAGNRRVTITVKFDDAVSGAADSTAAPAPTDSTTALLPNPAPAPAPEATPAGVKS
jgi:chemotaxis protein MotB